MTENTCRYSQFRILRKHWSFCDDRLIVAAMLTILSAMVSLDVLQLWLGGLVASKEREARNPTGNLQVAADGAGTDSVCSALVSALLALAARRRRAARRAWAGGGSHDDLALGATLRSGTGTAVAPAAQAHQQILAGR